MSLDTNTSGKAGYAEVPSREDKGKDGQDLLKDLLEVIIGTYAYDSEAQGLGSLNPDIILEVDSAIKADPTRYHRFAAAYGAVPLDQAERSQLAKAKLEAERLAPITQAFAEVMLAETGLSKQKDLKKHANNNPVLYGMCKRLFQQMKRQMAIDEKASGSKKRK